MLASSLGWMLDGMDITLYTMVIASLLSGLRISTGMAGALASITLIASAIGGVAFGFLADRLGRRTALMASISVYSVFTAACGFAWGITAFAVFRFLLGLGMGGEWATGASLVVETWRPEHRGKALGLMQSGFAVGYVLAAAIAALILPRWGWRAVFFAGIIPACVTLWIRRKVPESPAWLAEQAKPEMRAHGSQPSIIRAQGGLILLTLLMNSAALFAWWGLFTWIPPYLALPVSRGGRGLSIAASAGWIACMQVGMWLGYVAFGFASDRIGSKRTYIGFLLLAATLAPLYALARSRWWLLAIGPALAFFGTGHFTGFGIITAELFPTAHRATIMGLTYNFGRGLSAAAPLAIGLLAGKWGFESAFWLAAASFLVAALLALRLPEGLGAEAQSADNGRPV
ncbi:MAG: MFS transporter [Terriglobia bacterium]